MQEQGANNNDREIYWRGQGGVKVGGVGIAPTTFIIYFGYCTSIRELVLPRSNK